MEQILSLLSSYPVVLLILSVLGVLLSAADAIVRLTPSQSDDEFIGKLYNIPVLGSILEAVKRLSSLGKKSE